MLTIWSFKSVICCSSCSKPRYICSLMCKATLYLMGHFLVYVSFVVPSDQSYIRTIFAGQTIFAVFDLSQIHGWLHPRPLTQSGSNPPAEGQCSLSQKRLLFWRDNLGGNAPFLLNLTSLRKWKIVLIHFVYIITIDRNKFRPALFILIGNSILNT